MRILYHFALCPFSRKIRLLLHEKRLEFEMRSENFWMHSEVISRLNPAKQVPILIDNGFVVSDSAVISEFLEEKYKDGGCFIGRDLESRSEVRRIELFFDNKFFAECVSVLLFERVIKYYSSSESPDSNMIRCAKNAMLRYLEYIDDLLNRRQWIAGSFFSLADITVASHISVLDYLNDIPWKDFPVVKDWYAVVKSRPSFKSILFDRIPGFMPKKHYEQLDF